MGLLKQEDFKQKWIQQFGCGVSSKFIKTHVYDGDYGAGYVWHVFSYEEISENLYFHGNKASEEYDKIDKTDALIYLYFEEEEFPITQEFSSSGKIFGLNYSEIYVYNKDFSWCYIKTHECINDKDYLGPYFIKL